MQPFYRNCELVMNQTSQTICERGQYSEHLLVLSFDVISEPFRFPLLIVTMFVRQTLFDRVDGAP